MGINLEYSWAYKYFVSYAFSNDKGHGFGNEVVSLTEKIESDREIKEIENWIIENKGDNNVSLISFQLVDEHEDEWFGR